MFLYMFQFIQMISFVSACTLWMLTFGMTSTKKKFNLELWVMRLVLGFAASLNTLLFISTVI